MWFDEPLDVERAREVLRTRLVERFPRFRRRIAEPPLGIGLPSWQEAPDFDLDLHLHRVALPAPGDKAALEALVGDLVTVPLPRSRPLWDIHVIEGYGEGTAVLSRMHHCIADGIALARVLLSLTDAEPDAGLAAPAPVHDGGPLSTLAGAGRAGAHAAEASLHEWLTLARHPEAEGSRLLDAATANGRALAKLLLTGTDAPSPLRGKLGVARRVRWTDPIDLEEIKAIGHATHTTVNDVVLTAVTGALHRYLADRGGLVDEIRAMVPFNLRPPDEPLPRDLGNRFGLVYLTLPVGIEDPAQRLAELHRRMDAIKHSPEGRLSYAILGAIGTTPVPVEQRLIGLFTPKVTAVMTNVPGPREPVYFAGSRVAGVLGWVPAAGEIGIGLSIFSYDDRLTVGLQVDAGLIPDPETILDTLGDELAALAAPNRNRLTPAAHRHRDGMHLRERPGGWTVA
jgi:WS/DGAT/MGAT family acyltransferase